MATAGGAFCSARTSFVTAVTVASTVLSGLPEGAVMVIETVEVLLSVVDVLERWPDPAWQAAASGSTAKTMSRVFRRGMGFSGSIVSRKSTKNVRAGFFPRILHAGREIGPNRRPRMGYTADFACVSTVFAVNGCRKLSIRIPRRARRVSARGEHCLILMPADV
jgi:hypothetical protein